MPKKFIWLALLMGGLPMTIFYIIDILFQFHFYRNHVELCFFLNMGSLLLTGWLYIYHFKRWVKDRNS